MNTRYMLHSLASAAFLMSSFAVSAQDAAPQASASALGAQLSQAELAHRLKMADQRRVLEGEALSAEIAETIAKKNDAEKRKAESLRDAQRAARGEDTYAPTARPLGGSAYSLPPPPMMSMQGSASAPAIEVPPAPRRPVAPVEPPLPSVQALIGDQAIVTDYLGTKATVRAGDMIGEHRVVAVSDNAVVVAWKDKARHTLRVQVR